VNGPKGSGKSTLMHCVHQLSFRGSIVVTPSAASLYRDIHIHAPTVLVDEAEKLEEANADPALMATLLHSNQRGATVPRCDGDDHTVKNFSVFGPKAFFSIAEPHDTLADRSIRIPMLRSPKGSPKCLIDPRDPKYKSEWQAIRDGWYTLILNHGQQLHALAEPEDVTPKAMFPRSRQIWRPLLQLAELMERLGVNGLLGRMQALALDKSAVSEAITVDAVEEFILRAFVQLRAEGKTAVTSTAVLTAAYARGLDPTLRVTDKAVGAILRRYDIKHGTGVKRREWVATDKHLAAIDSAYGFGLFDDGKNTDPHPPEKSVISVRSVMSAVETVTEKPSETREKHQKPDTSDTSDAFPGVVPEVSSTKGEVRL